MKKAVIVLLLILSGCATYRPMAREDLTIHTELDAPGLTADQIFEKSLTWLTRHLYSHRKIIDYADREAGVIIANGYIDYPTTGELEAIDKIQYTISFTLREEIKRGKISITFDNLLLDVPKYYYHSRFWPEKEVFGGYSIPIKKRTDFEAARKGLLELAAKLAEYLTFNP